MRQTPGVTETVLVIAPSAPDMAGGQKGGAEGTKRRPRGPARLARPQGMTAVGPRA